MDDLTRSRIEDTKVKAAEEIQRIADERANEIQKEAQEEIDDLHTST